MTPLVLLAVAAVAAVVFARSSRHEPRRWRNGVLFLVAVWAVLAAVGELLRPVPARVQDTAVLVLALPWAAALVLGLLFVGTGLRMVRRGGRSVANLLSLLVGAGLVAATVIGVALLLSGRTAPSMVGIVVLLLPGYPALTFLSYLLYCLLYRRHRARHGPAAVLVLGSGLVDGAVPRLLARRLDAGMAAWHDEHERGHDPLLVPTGGQGADEPVPEGVAMTAYLIEHGIAPGDILTEDRARTTEENLALSRDLLRLSGVDVERRHVRVVTSSYHVGRAALISRRYGLDADVTGARTSWYLVPSAFLREFLAAVALHPWTNAVGLVVWAAWTAFMTPQHTG